MHLQELAGTILGFAAIVGLGAILRSARLVRAEDSRALNAVIIYVGLPAFVFNAVHAAPLSTELLSVVAVAWIVFGVLLGAALLAVRLLKLPPSRAGGFVLVSALGNTGYLGYPLTAALLGASAVPSAVFYDVFGTVFALVLVGMPLAARYGARAAGDAAETTPRFSAIRELLAFPAVIALFVALALRGFDVPNPVSDWLALLGSMVAPLIMLSVGISLRPRSIVAGAKQIAIVAGLKLVMAPLIAIAAASVLVGQAEPWRAAVLEASMPSMMLTLAIGERYRLDTDFIASAIFVTTVLSAASVPLVQALLR